MHLEIKGSYPIRSREYSISKRRLPNMNNLFKNILNRVQTNLDRLGFDSSDEMDVNVIEIDGKEYSEIMRLDLDGKTYVYLSVLDDPGDFIIHRLIEENGETFIEGLDNKEEFDNALLHFTETMLKGD